MGKPATTPAAFSQTLSQNNDMTWIIILKYMFLFWARGARPLRHATTQRKSRVTQTPLGLKIVRDRSYYYFAILVMRARARIAHTHAVMKRVI